MKKNEPFTIYQIALFLYLIALGGFIMILGIISFAKLKLWLIAVILGLPFAIYLGLKIKEYIYEGGLEEYFKTKKQ